MQTQMFWWCGHSLPFSTPRVASHKLPTFCDPVPNGPGRKRLWCTRCSLCVLSSTFYSRLVKIVDSPSLLQKTTSSEMGVTQVPIACYFNTELYYTAISHHVIPEPDKSCSRSEVYLSVWTFGTCIKRESAALLWMEVLKNCKSEMVCFYIVVFRSLRSLQVL